MEDHLTPLHPCRHLLSLNHKTHTVMFQRGKCRLILRCCPSLQAISLKNPLLSSPLLVIDVKIWRSCFLFILLWPNCHIWSKWMLCCRLLCQRYLYNGSLLAERFRAILLNSITLSRIQFRSYYTTTCK